MAFAVDLTGTILDRRYQLTGLLGKGGMGHVYDAMHMALEQRVAIKVLHPRYAYEERFRERFLQEARAASKIKHRNVVEIKDFGDTPDGSVYFAMEYLGGHDVGVELAEHGPLSWSRTRNILLQAASALHAAHAKQIIHRDIKPGNCFLIEDSEDGLADAVKLLDFGIAKVGSDSHADAQGKGLTGTGEVFGTASYMSPEQARGETLDARSDMYSLGIMAYEMLVGQVPFTGVNAIHVITQHLSTAPEPLRSHVPELSEEVEALVMKMIAKTPRDRYASMDAIEHALRAIPEASGEKVRRTKLWSSPGELRALVAEKQAANVGVVPPGGAVGTDAERTELVTPAAPASGGRVVKRTVARTEVPLADGATPLLAPSFGARPTTAASGSASEPNMQVPARGPMEWAPAGHAEAPPARDDSVPPPSAWPPSTASTGPHGRVGDTGTETYPHVLEAAQRPGISGRLVAMVGLLVLLVGGGSAMGTMMVLSEQQEPKEGEPAVVEPVVETAVESAAIESAAVRPEVEVEVESESPVESAGAEPEPADPEPAVVEPESTSIDEIAEQALDVGAPAPEEDDYEASELVEDATAEAPRPVAAATPSVPGYQTEKCVELRAQAEAALDRHAWRELADHAKRKKCWPPSEQSKRLRMHVWALLEGAHFEECVKAAGRTTDPETLKWRGICEKRVKLGK